jgi:PAS domain S-box-containing protein
MSILNGARRGADEARYRSMIESAPAYFYLAGPEDSSTLYRSPQAATILGYADEDWNTNPDLWSQILHPDDRQRVLSEFAECGRGGKPFRCEYRLLTKTGELRWVRDHATLLRDPSGPGMIVQGVVLDITEQKVAELAADRARAESEDKSRFLDNVFEHAPLGVARAGIDMRVTDANPRLRSMLWSGDGDMVGAHIGQFLAPEELERVIAVFVPLWKGTVDRIESDSLAVRRDGTRLWLHWTATTVPRSDGRIGHFLVMFEDTTAKHQAEEATLAALAELERLNHLKSEFVSVVSHEFRTALTGIQGFSELMRDEDMEPAEVKDLAKDINLDAQRLNRLITEMLDLDRMEAGRMTLRSASVDLNAMLVESVERARVANPGHVFTTQLDPAVPILTADSDRIVQVIANLLSNAVKYSPQGGEIRVRSQLLEVEVTVSVLDHGLGIPASFLPRLFQRYERYNNSATDRIIGTGLGLPIARQIIEMHNGRIWVDSIEGSGSEFHFTLPTSPRVGPLRPQRAEGGA